MSKKPDLPDYQALALKIVPPSHHRTVSQLRSMIAETLEKEIQSALIKQREEAFPDLLDARVELETMGRKHKEAEEKLQKWKDDWKAFLENREKELDERGKEQNLRELDLQKAEKTFQSLLSAFEAYEAWLEGEGQIDENGKRFSALREAYKAYRNLTPKETKK